jgi:hypothetical protein
MRLSSVGFWCFFSLPVCAVQPSVPTCTQPEVRHKQQMLSYWGNPDYDTALLLTMASGNVTTVPVRRLEDYVNSHIIADLSVKIGCASRAAVCNVVCFAFVGIVLVKRLEDYVDSRNIADLCVVIGRAFGDQAA